MVGYLVHLPKVPHIFPVKEAQVEKDHYPLKCLSCLSRYQVLISPVNIVYISLMLILSLGSL